MATQVKRSELCDGKLSNCSLPKLFIFVDDDVVKMDGCRQIIKKVKSLRKLCIGCSWAILLRICREERFVFEENREGKGDVEYNFEPFDIFDAGIRLLKYCVLSVLLKRWSRTVQSDRCPFQVKADGKSHLGRLRRRRLLTSSVVN